MPVVSCQDSVVSYTPASTDFQQLEFHNKIDPTTNIGNYLQACADNFTSVAIYTKGLTTDH
jgi:hypothetical protein